MLGTYHVAGWCVLVGAAPSPVRESFGPVSHTAWGWMLLACPLLVLGGVLVPDQWAGTWLRLGGTVALSSVFAGYAVALADSDGVTAFSVVVYTGLALATLVVGWREIRGLRAIATLVREERPR